MRIVYGLLLGAALCTSAAAAELTEVQVTPPAGWSVSAIGRPRAASLQGLADKPQGVRAQKGRLLFLSRGSDQAAVLYLGFASDGDAQAALPRLRRTLWSGDVPPLGAPRILRAGNVIAVVDADTLSITMAVSRRLAGAGPVQDAAATAPSNDSSDEPEEASAPPAPVSPGLLGGPGAAGTEAAASEREARSAAAGNPQLMAKVAAGLGRHAQRSTEAGSLLEQKRYPEALRAYQQMEREVLADRGAPLLARWDAASGVGLAAAYSGKMAEARLAFRRALASAARLDARKLAETLFNLACAEAELGNKNGALQALKGCLDAARKAGPDKLAHYRETFTTDKSLRSLQGDPRLKRLVASAK